MSIIRMVKPSIIHPYSIKRCSHKKNEVDMNLLT